MWPPPFPPQHFPDVIILGGWLGLLVIAALVVSVFVPDIVEAVRGEVSDDD